MGQFTNGVLVGLGISLLFAPKKGEELRRLLGQSLQTLRSGMPENQESQQDIQQFAGRVQDVLQTDNRAFEVGRAAQSGQSDVARLSETEVPASPSMPSTASTPSSVSSSTTQTRPGQSKRSRP